MAADADADAAGRDVALRMEVERAVRNMGRRSYISILLDDEGRDVESLFGPKWSSMRECVQRVGAGWAFRGASHCKNSALVWTCVVCGDRGVLARCAQHPPEEAKCIHCAVRSDLEKTARIREILGLLPRTKATKEEEVE